MIVQIQDISQAGLKINDTVSLDALNARMNEGGKNDILFTEAPKVDIQIQKTASGAVAYGVVVAKFRQPCGVCLDDLDREIEISADFIFEPKPDREPTSNNFDDEVGIHYYEGEHVNLEEVIQEALILSLNPNWIPALGENGSCDYCGKERKNTKKKVTTQNLGDLLKQAAESSKN